MILRHDWSERAETPPARTGAMTYLRGIAARDGIELGELQVDVSQRGEGRDYRLQLSTGKDDVQAVYEYLIGEEKE